MVPLLPGILANCQVSDCGRSAKHEYPTWWIPAADRWQSFNADLAHAYLCPEHKHKWGYDGCQVRGCDSTPPVLFMIPLADWKSWHIEWYLGFKGRPENYEEWKRYPTHVLVCHKHFSELRTKNGRVLGYRKRDGKIRAYVKEELF